jgi:hypothetical protein
MHHCILGNKPELILHLACLLSIRAINRTATRESIVVISVTPELVPFHCYMMTLIENSVGRFYDTNSQQ